jgi:hypothetical protein
LNALPTRCGGEADQISDLGDRVRGVLLEEGENLAVDGVHSENSISADKCGSAAVGRIISSQLRSFQLYLENYSIASQNRIGVPVARVASENVTTDPCLC